MAPISVLVRQPISDVVDQGLWNLWTALRTCSLEVGHHFVPDPYSILMIGV
jgi:hypothetical protein